MADSDSFNLGRNGGYEGPDTNRTEFLAGQHARAVALQNQGGASTSYLPKDRGDSAGGGGGLGLGALAIAPFLLAMAIFAVLPAWLLSYTLKVPPGHQPLTWFARYKAALYVAVAFNTLPAFMLAMGVASKASSQLAISGVSLVMATIVMKWSLRDQFRGPGGWWRATRSAVLVAVISAIPIALTIAFFILPMLAAA